MSSSEALRVKNTYHTLARWLNSPSHLGLVGSSTLAGDGFGREEGKWGYSAHEITRSVSRAALIGSFFSHPLRIDAKRPTDGRKAAPIPVCSFLPKKTH